MRTFLENNSVVDASIGRTQSQFTWQPGDVSITPFEGSIFTTEDYASSYMKKRQEYYDSFVNRGHSVRNEYNTAPAHMPIHPDEFHNQMAHRSTYQRGDFYGDTNQGEMGPNAESMRRAHNDYKGNSSYFNKRLRHPGNHREDHIALETTEGPYHDGGFGDARRYEHLDAVTKHPTIRPMSLYRGFGSGLDLKNMSPGTEFVDHGYTGLSHKRSIAGSYSTNNPGYQHDPVTHKRQVAMVHVPAGTYGHTLDLTGHGYHAPSMSGLEDEHEFLLHRGTHFRVMGHSLVTHGEFDPQTHGKQTHVVHLQVVGQHPRPLRSGSDVDRDPDRPSGRPDHDEDY